MSNRRFTDSGDAFQEILDSWNTWSSAVGKYGVQTTYALIAANWGVHGSNTERISNTWSLASFAVAIAFLAIHLLSTYWVSLLYRQRVNYADENRERWNTEYLTENKNGTAWPFTKLIEWVGLVLLFLKAVIPVISGSLFIVSLYF